MNFMITCPNGLSQILKNEIKKLGYEVLQSQDRIVYFSGDESAMYLVNLWSRIGNKLFLEIQSKKISNFDDFWDGMYGIEWTKYISQDHPIQISIDSKNSNLTSIPALQALSKKAIVKKLVGDGRLFEDRSLPVIEIYIFVEGYTMKVFLNTSGEPLFKRGYQRFVGQAPLKENIAAGIVHLVGWKFGETFYDPFCGSGTIGIEAGMIAKNIAPGLGRGFAFEYLPFFDSVLFTKIRSDSKSKIRTTKKYDIVLGDIDSESVRNCLLNVQKFDLADSISVSRADFKDLKNKTISGTMVCNPPYGIRLNSDDTATLQDLYGDLFDLYELNPNLNGGIFTSFEYLPKVSNPNWKAKKMYNGNLETIFYIKKS